jgi:membrane protein YdbS with pleckstrin-like domain
MGMVTLPVWVFAIVAALALWAVLDLLVIPAVRWLIRLYRSRSAA